MSNEDHDKPGWALDLGRSIGVIGIIIGIVALFITDTSGGNRLATLGGTLVAGAAALLFIEALSVQRKELSLTREELQQTRLEMQAQREEMQAQKIEFEKQNKIAEWDAMYKHLQVLLERDGRENYEGLKDIYMECFEKILFFNKISFSDLKTPETELTTADPNFWRCVQMHWGNEDIWGSKKKPKEKVTIHEVPVTFPTIPYFLHFWVEKKGSEEKGGKDKEDKNKKIRLSIELQNYLLNSVLLMGLLRRMKMFAKSNEMSDYYTNLDVYNMFTSVKFEITFHYLVFYRKNFELAQYVSDEIIKDRPMLIEPAKEVNDRFFKGNKTGTYGVLEEGLEAFY